MKTKPNAAACNPLLIGLLFIALSTLTGIVSAGTKSGSSSGKTINAELEWATYLGTPKYEAGEDIALGPDGTIYVTGFDMVFLSGPPWVLIDSFVARLSADGTELLDMLLIQGADIDGAIGIAVDRRGTVTVVGQTYSSDFPVTEDAFQSTPGGDADGFVMQLSPELELKYCTLFGGDGEESFTDVALDGKGGLILSGYTGSTNLPVTEGAFQTSPGGGKFDAFVARLVPGKDPSEQLTYATYLGGSDSDTDPDVIDDRLLRQGVDVMPNGNIVVTGMTLSEDFPVTKGAIQTENMGDMDLYVTVLDPQPGKPAARQLVYSTLLGGTGREKGENVVVRGCGQITLVGVSRSTDFPVTNNAHQASLLGEQDAVVVQLLAVPRHRGARLTYSSYLGGSGRDAANGLCQLPGGDVVVTGVAGSNDFPVTDDSVLQGEFDLFLARLDTSRRPARQLVMGTLFGGSGDEILAAGPVADRHGNLYITGDTGSDDLPGVTGSYQDTFSGGGLDALVAKFSMDKPRCWPGWWWTWEQPKSIRAKGHLKRPRK
jgi:hypothetical protein